MQGDSSSIADDVSGEYAAILGIKPEKYQTKVLLFQVRNVKRLHWLEWMFLLLALFSIMGTLGLTIQRIVHTKSNSRYLTEHCHGCCGWKCDPDFTFAILLIVNLVFCTVYAIDGLFREQKYEMLTYTGGVLVIVVYVISNYIDHGRNGEDIRLVRLILLCVFGPLNMIFAVMVFYRMGFLELNFIGANITHLRIYRTGVEFCTWLKFNFQIAVSCLAIVLCRPNSEVSVSLKVILSVGVALVALWTIIGWMLVYKENVLLAVVFILMSSIEAAFYIYLLVETGIRHDKFKKNETVFVASVLYIGGSLGIINFALIIIWFFRIIVNFGAGMKEKILP
ncbi:uncharacterized protein [Dysidea avara]|uniref:uncharacterized protein n=1 Tax=Dysidea avara TaxID=196820 RepID=UPI003321A8D2